MHIYNVEKQDYLNLLPTPHQVIQQQVNQVNKIDGNLLINFLSICVSLNNRYNLIESKEYYTRVGFLPTGERLIYFITDHKAMLFSLQPLSVLTDESYYIESENELVSSCCN